MISPLQPPPSSLRWKTFFFPSASSLQGLPDTMSYKSIWSRIWYYIHILYMCQCKSWLVYLLPHCWRLFFLIKEVFSQVLSLCMVSIQEWFVIKSGLLWRAYGNWNRNDTWLESEHRYFAKSSSNLLSHFFSTNFEHIGCFFHVLLIILELLQKFRILLLDIVVCGVFCFVLFVLLSRVVVCSNRVGWFCSCKLD